MRKSALILAGLLLLAAGTLSDAAHAAGPVGQVTHLSGVLTAKRADGSTKVFSVKSEVLEGDTLSTERDTYARVKFADGGEVVLRPRSQLKVAAYAFDQTKPESDSVILDMLRGGLRSVTGLIGKRNRHAVSFTTATATIGLRGTHFGALICQTTDPTERQKLMQEHVQTMQENQNDCDDIPTVTGKPPENGLHLDVADGAIVVKNQAGEQVITSGEFGFVQNANTAPVIVPPSQGIQVTMPTSISQNSSSGRGIGKGKENECAP